MPLFQTDTAYRQTLIEDICRLSSTSEANRVSFQEGLSKLTTKILETRRADLECLCKAGGELLERLSAQDRQVFMALSRKPSEVLLESLARLNALKKSDFT